MKTPAGGLSLKIQAMQPFTPLMTFESRYWCRSYETSVRCASHTRLWLTELV